SMDEEGMREAAKVSGGRFYREEDLAQLPASLVPRKAVFTERRETLLWNAPMLALFIGLITVEWILRKFSNLS
ncbi:MAG TPA: hypothetical protein VEN81_14835, partial [Planctomycetota bacterium]|nr:hypothetical protein [Planctomycetota bacterium]